MAAKLYDEIGVGYSDYRRPDPRIAAAIHSALGDAASVVNVGAGTGSYEPKGSGVVAVEPSSEMIRQRSSGSAPALQAEAAALPFGDDTFDAALAVLTLHHWTDRLRGLAELARVARERVVILTFDPEACRCFWLVEDYFPLITEIDRTLVPTLAEYRQALGALEIREIPVPHDCSDGFLGAYWRRPERYLDDGARRAISAFQKIDTEPGLQRLRADLDSGRWHENYGGLLERDALDLGYRLLISAPRSG
ncbi:MAG: methyltransferase domain-containing protein [Deltaproteobacteria bacterium]|nr:methyltransferase domain-containing protein [Deltaproteobacteria bacterium]MBW2416451.1 methyltransferase domain-containing protein [Deltaproteobacteria bacterium]